MSDSKNPFLNSAVLLTAATGFLYSVSTAFYGGYLEPLRLDSGVLDRNFQQTLYYGFIISFVPIFLGLLIYGSTRYLYSHMILPDLITWLKHSWASKRRFIKLKSRFLGKRKDSLYVREQKRHTITTLLYLALFVGFLYSLAYFENKGKKAGFAVITKLDNEVPNTDLLIVKIDGQIYKLLELTCGARNCAGIEPTTRVVYYFPQNGHSFLHSPTVQLKK
jgi:hypothetical protein